MNCSIPDHWTGDEALTFVAFLEDIIQLIWDAHGAAMARQLQRADDHVHDGGRHCPRWLDPHDDHHPADEINDDLDHDPSDNDDNDDTPPFERDPIPF